MYHSCTKDTEPLNNQINMYLILGTSISYVDVTTVNIDHTVSIKYDGKKFIGITIDKDVESTGLCGNNDGIAESKWYF